ncbi:hypothetical protein [Gilvimarinus xylanilyticus]|nr:hypothetical protein [Gilvimarinus xylanilyticus]
MAENWVRHRKRQWVAKPSGVMRDAEPMVQLGWGLTVGVDSPA